MGGLEGELGQYLSAMPSQAALKYLSKIYHNPKHPASYSSVQTLYDFVKRDGKHLLTKADVKHFLESEEVHSTHVKKPRAKKFYSIISPYPSYMIDVDSIYFEFPGEKMRRIIVGIDTFSRRAAARAVKDLKAATVDKALSAIVDELKPERIRFDRGTEYNNSTVASTLKRKGVNYFVASPPHKANYAERFGGRTLKNLLYKVLQHRGDKHWPKYLQQVIDAYNNRQHASLNMTPNEASKRVNTAKLWFRFRSRRYRAMPPPTPYTYDINDAVRISNVAQPLDKAYYETFSGQIYFVSARYTRSNVHRYRLKDYNNEPVANRSFDQKQLQLTHTSGDTLYRVEKVLHEKLFKGKLYSFVKWVGYPSRFNTYIPSSDIVNLEKNKK